MSFIKNLDFFITKKTQKMEKYLIEMMKHLETVAANQKLLAETQEKLAMALEQMAENQATLVLGQKVLMKSLGATKSPADALDEIFKDLEKLQQN